MTVADSSTRVSSTASGASAGAVRDSAAGDTGVNAAAMRVPAPVSPNSARRLRVADTSPTANRADAAPATPPLD